VGAVGLGTAPRAGRSRVRLPNVSLEFFTEDVGSKQPLKEMSTRDVCLRIKAAGA
jgi:hypothetical protein